MKNLICLIFQPVNIIPGTPVYDANSQVIYGLTLPIMKDEPPLTIPFNLISDIYENIPYYFQVRPTGIKKDKVHIQPFVLSMKQIFNLKMSIRIVLCTY